MANLDLAGISKLGGYLLSNEGPLDVRTLVTEKSHLTELVTSRIAYPGMIVYVNSNDADKGLYLCSSNTDGGTWERISITDTTYSVLSAAEDGDNDSLVTTGEKFIWNNKVDTEDGKGLSTNDLTDALKGTYDSAYSHSVATHAPVDAEKNQNAFNKVTISDVTITASNVEDTLTLAAGSNVTLTPDESSNKITITAAYPEAIPDDEIIALFS